MHTNKNDSTDDFSCENYTPSFLCVLENDLLGFTNKRFSLTSMAFLTEHRNKS